MKALKRLNELFPGSGFVQIRPYDPAAWEGKEYDSKLENKAPLTKWKSSPLKFEQAMALAKLNYRIGWIIPDKIVVVDIDNEDHVESSAYVERILHELKIPYIYNRTNRGLHILFKDSEGTITSDAVMKCALGITVDHRANGSGYIILPTNDPHRTWGDWEYELEEIPYFLKPMMIAKNQIDSFIGMDEGSGRNTELFKWRTKILQCNKLNDEQVEEVLNIINDHLFEIPMTNQEMTASVTKKRETDAEQRAKGKQEKLNVLEKENIYNTVANRIVNEFDMMCIGHKQYYQFDKTFYRPMREIDLERLIHHEISENIVSQGRKEIMNFLAVKTLVEPDEIDRIWNKIAVGNGVLDVVTGELSAPDKREKNTISIPWNYDSNPLQSPKIDEFMTDIAANRDGTVNEMKQQFLYQIAGYCLLKRNYFGKFFIFRGEGGTGKSTFQDLIVKLVGDVNRARVGLDKMDQDYYLATLLSKLVNIDDDAVDGRVLENTGRFKSLVSGNEITVRQIFKEPVTFLPFATCMFSCNKLPKIMDKTSGLYRRMVIIELNNKVIKPDPLFLEKLTARDMEYFLFKAVYWVGIALQEGKFRISQSEKELLRKFKCRQSSLNEWISEEELRLKDFYNKPARPLYVLYMGWAQENGYKFFPSILTFKEDINALFSTEIGYAPGVQQIAINQIFTRRLEPTVLELEEEPF